MVVGLDHDALAWARFGRLHGGVDERVREAGHPAAAGAFIAGHGFNDGSDRHLRNNGTAKFTHRSAAHFPTVIDPTTDAALGDIDADRDLDHVVGNSGDNGAERVLVQYVNGHGP